MKKRINMIIGKKQIVIAGLTLILGVAVYVNFATGTKVTKDEPVGGATDGSNYGDVQFVSGGSAEQAASAIEGSNEQQQAVLDTSDSASTDAYFIQARLDKEASRAEAVEVLQSLYLSGDSTETELAVMAESAAQLSSYIESESKIENMLKAQGFEDVLCYLSDNKASIIVKTSGLDTAQAAQIKNALLSEVTVSNENITIVEIN